MPWHPILEPPKDDFESQDKYYDREKEIQKAVQSLK